MLQRCSSAFLFDLRDELPEVFFFVAIHPEGQLRSFRGSNSNGGVLAELAFDVPLVAFDEVSCVHYVAFGLESVSLLELAAWHQLFIFCFLLLEVLHELHH